MSLESFLYVMAAEGTNTKLFKIDLRNLKDTTLGHGVYLDLKLQLQARMIVQLINNIYFTVWCKNRINSSR